MNTKVLCFNILLIVSDELIYIYKSLLIIYFHPKTILKPFQVSIIFINFNILLFCWLRNFLIRLILYLGVLESNNNI